MWLKPVKNAIRLRVMVKLTSTWQTSFGLSYHSLWILSLRSFLIWIFFGSTKESFAHLFTRLSCWVWWRWAKLIHGRDKRRFFSTYLGLVPLILFLKGEAVDFSCFGALVGKIVVLCKDGELQHFVGTTIDAKTCHCVLTLLRICSGTYFDVLKMRFFTSQVVR